MAQLVKASSINPGDIDLVPTREQIEPTPAKCPLIPVIDMLWYTCCCLLIALYLICLPLCIFLCLPLSHIK